MTSRRKAKRVLWAETMSNMFVLEKDGTRRPMVWYHRWYQTPEKMAKQRHRWRTEPDKMLGCVKKSVQQQHRGSWNLIPLDPWYSKGWISWRRDF